MTLEDLIDGEFAITGSGLGVLALSPRSFRPVDDGYANVVHLANGVGAFLKREGCTKVSRQEAFAAAEKYGWGRR